MVAAVVQADRYDHSEVWCTQDGYFSHPTDCRKFVRCVSNGHGHFTAYVFSCAPGTAWDPRSNAPNKCIRDDDTECRNDRHSYPGDIDHPDKSECDDLALATRLFNGQTTE